MSKVKNKIVSSKTLYNIERIVITVELNQCYAWQINCARRKVKFMFCIYFFSGNPITCNCNISWIVPLQGHRYLDGYCVAPESLTERSLVTLREKDFLFCRGNVTET